MAKVTGPLHSVEARGRMGGLIYNTWRGINFVKANCGPCQPRTERQLRIRALQTWNTRSWSDLTDVQRQSWNTYATIHAEIDWTGNSRRLTGANWYTRCNTRLRDMGALPVSLAPTDNAPAPVPDLETDGLVNQIKLKWTALTGTDLTVDIWMTAAHSAGRQMKIESARHALYAEGETGSATITPVPPGRYTIFYRTISEKNGLDSTWQKLTVDVTAA